MNTKCPWFEKCGGCKFDFTASDYRTKKKDEIKDITTTQSPIWLSNGQRIRADFCFASGKFGFYESGTKNIIPVTYCPNLIQEINDILPGVTNLPWGGAGACLITKCENGIDIAITSSVPYFTPEFRSAAQKIPAIRITWNGKIIKQTQQPVIKIEDKIVDYPSGAFLQPSKEGADTLRNLVKKYSSNAKKIVDLFCGLGNFTYATNADGFDIVGCGIKRDLFKNPLTLGMLKQYDCVIMDPPRAGAIEQCKILVKSDIKRIIYISCNPNTFVRDMKILNNGGYKTVEIIPVDQFVGSTHWEIFAIFEKE